MTLLSAEDLLRYLPLLERGALTTLALFALTAVLGFAIAVPVALARNAGLWIASLPAHAFVLFFRGAPLLALLFLAYYGLPQVPGIRDTAIWFFVRDPFPVAVTVLALNSAGFQAEIIAGTLRAVPRGELEAARAEGFGPFAVFRIVLLPHAVRIGARSYGDELVFILKSTAVVSLITIRDMMSVSNELYLRTFDPLTPLLIAGAFYLAVVGVIRGAVVLAERSVTPECLARRSLASAPVPHRST